MKLENTQQSCETDALVAALRGPRAAWVETWKSMSMAAPEVLREAVCWPYRPIACGANRLLLEAPNEIVVSVEPVFSNHVDKPFAELHSERLLQNVQSELQFQIALLPITWGYLRLDYAALTSLAPWSMSMEALVGDGTDYSGFCVVRILTASRCTMWDLMKLKSCTDEFLMSCALDVICKIVAIQSVVPDFVHGDLHVANVLVPCSAGRQTNEWVWTADDKRKQEMRTIHTLIIDFDMSSFNAQTPQNDFDDLWLNEKRVTIHKDPMQDVLKFMHSFASASSTCGRTACAELFESVVSADLLSRCDQASTPTETAARAGLHHVMDAVVQIRARCSGWFPTRTYGASVHRISLRSTVAPSASAPSPAAPSPSEAVHTTACAVEVGTKM